MEMNNLEIVLINLRLEQISYSGDIEEKLTKGGRLMMNVLVLVSSDFCLCE